MPLLTLRWGSLYPGTVGPMHAILLPLPLLPSEATPAPL